MGYRNPEPPKSKRRDMLERLGGLALLIFCLWQLWRMPFVGLMPLVWIGLFFVGVILLLWLASRRNTDFSDRR